MYPESMTIERFDPDLAQAIAGEKQRQEDHIELIASENYASPRVLEAQGSVLTNKYAEGYPGKRYYGGCEFVDVVEQLAIDRARRLFGADFANVQAHSGSQANAAAYLALVNPGDTVMGMSLDHGGHLTHGSKVNFSGKLFRIVSYGLRASDGTIDYDQMEQLALAEKPKMIIAGFSAYSRHLDFVRFRRVADQVGAYLMVDMAHVAGLVAAGLSPNPVPFADVVTSTTHKTLRGPRGGLILARSNPEIEKKLNSLVFPGTQGGPLMHVIAAKAVAFQEALQPDFKTYQQQVLVNARAMASTFQRRGYRIVSGGYRQPPVPARSLRQEHEWQGSRRRARRRAHHREQERGAERPAPAHRDQRHPHRFAGLDHARLQGSRDDAGRGLDRRHHRCQW